MSDTTSANALEKHERFDEVRAEFAQWLESLGPSQRGTPGDRGWRERCVCKAADFLWLRTGRVTTRAIAMIIGFGSNTQLAGDLQQWREQQTRTRDAMVDLSGLIDSPTLQSAWRDAITALLTSARDEARRLARAELEAERVVAQRTADDALRQAALAGAAASRAQEGEAEARRAQALAVEQAVQAREEAAVMNTRMEAALSAAAQAREATDMANAEASRSRAETDAAIERLNTATRSYQQEVTRLEGAQKRMLLEIEAAREGTRAARDAEKSRSADIDRLMAKQSQMIQSLQAAAAAQGSAETEARMFKAELALANTKIDDLQRRLATKDAMREVIARMQAGAREQFARCASATEVVEDLEGELAMSDSLPFGCWLAIDARSITPTFESVAELEGWCSEHLERLLALRDNIPDRLWWQTDRKAEERQR